MIVMENANFDSLIFSASRDRLIKLWSVKYGANDVRINACLMKLQAKLKATFDGHIDWVNQIV